MQKYPTGVVYMLCTLGLYPIKYIRLGSIFQKNIHNFSGTFLSCKMQCCVVTLCERRHADIAYMYILTSIETFSKNVEGCIYGWCSTKTTKTRCSDGSVQARQVIKRLHISIHLFLCVQLPLCIML